MAMAEFKLFEYDVQRNLITLSTGYNKTPSVDIWSPTPFPVPHPVCHPLFQTPPSVLLSPPCCLAFTLITLSSFLLVHPSIHFSLFLYYSYFILSSGLLPCMKFWKWMNKFMNHANSSLFCISVDEIAFLEGMTIVYKSSIDLFFYVVGSAQENEVKSFWVFFFNAAVDIIL